MLNLVLLYTHWVKNPVLGQHYRFGLLTTPWPLFCSFAVQKRRRKNEEIGLTRGQVPDHQLVALVPVPGLEQEQRFSVPVALHARSDGLGLVDPLVRDAEPLRQEGLLGPGLGGLGELAVPVQELTHRLLPYAGEREDRALLAPGTLLITPQEDTIQYEQLRAETQASRKANANPTRPRTL